MASRAGGGKSKRQKTSASFNARPANKNQDASAQRKRNLIIAICVGLCVFAILTLAGRSGGNANPDNDRQAVTGDVAAEYDAAITVKDYGVIKIALDRAAAPETVQNFMDLAESGFYDGLTFHRIMDGFMIQGGDPEGDGFGGSDHTIKGEFAANGFMNPISHVRGVISMARNAYDYNSASSQFFIVQSDSTFLDDNYAAFGYVTEGMEVVDQIAAEAEPTDDNGTILPENQPVIESIVISERDASESGM